MANPNLLGDGRINFVHCTAPTSVLGAPCPYRLRSHHESGIGVSTEVELPDGLTLTACRFSAETGRLSVRRAIGRRGEAQTTCRTQYEVTLSDYGAYLADPLGCHQVLAFEDISREMAALGEMLGLRVLSF